MSSTKVFLLCFISIIFFGRANAQEKSISRDLAFFERSPDYHKGRTIGVSATIAGLYGSSLIMLNELWYKDFPKEPFHTFDDSHEWLQIDKFGHSYTAYFQGNWGMSLYRWAGIKDMKAILIGGSVGFLNQTVIEILDSQSAQWGWSNADIIANGAGTALLIGQELLWREQRIQMKFGFNPVNYEERYTSDIATIARTEFGSGAQSLLKDYNAQTYWLSTNVSSFLNYENNFPKWINFAVGYGGDQMFHSEDNLNRGISDIDRRRQYLLSMDVDFTKIPTESHFLKTFFFLLNGFKVPFPTLEYTAEDKLKFRALY